MNQKQQMILLVSALPFLCYGVVKLLFVCSNLFFNETISRVENVFLDRYFISRYKAVADNEGTDPVLSNDNLKFSREQVSLVIVDKKTMEKLHTLPHFQKPKYEGWNVKQWPFDRRVMAEAITRIKELKASVIGIDLLYLHAKRDEEDAPLAEAIGAAGNVVMAGMMEHDFKGNLLEFKQPFELIRKNAAKVGFVNVDTDTDGILRSVPLLQKDPHGKQIYSFALQCWSQKPIHKNFDLEKIEVRNWKMEIPDKRLAEFKKTIHLYRWDEHQSRVLINWKGPANSFSTISFVDLFDPAHEDWIRTRTSGKTVLIGLHHPGLQDSYPTPLYSMTRTQTPGVEVHANMINTLSNANYRTVRLLPWYWELAIYAVFALILAYVTGFKRITISLPLLFMEFIVGWIFANLILFRTFYVLGSVMIIGLALILLYIIIITVRVLTREREKSEIRKVFNQYVSNQVVDELLHNPDNLSMGGNSLEITTLFSDIRGFTTMSEAKTPEEIVDILNTYFELMVAIITKYDGTINKFIGDAIMVLYGAPVRQNISPDQQAIACVKTAIEMQETLKASSDPRLQKLFLGIGITTGHSVVGNIGAKRHKDYTAIGDKINLAARLESKSQAYEIIVDQKTREYCGELFTFEELEPFQVKGKQEIIQAFKVLY